MLLRVENIPGTLDAQLSQMMSYVGFIPSLYPLCRGVLALGLL